MTRITINIADFSPDLDLPYAPLLWGRPHFEAVSTVHGLVEV